MFGPMWKGRRWTGPFTGTGKDACAGFTIMELMVVMVLVALLVGIAAPVVTTAIVRAKETALKHDLRVMRTAIDGYYADRGAYPPELEALVTERYIRNIPADPFTDSAATWIVVYDENEEDGGVVDVRSDSERTATDGSLYSSW